MILLADSGTTKCDWIFVDSLQQDKHFEINTAGLNPSYHTENEIKGVINNSNDILRIKSHVETVYFFGSGCGNKDIQKKMRDILSNVFYKSKDICVRGDIEGAVYACTNEKAVISILGTGSNACFFDGKNIDCRVASLGYSVMDDGGGNAIGRACLRAYFYNKMPKELAKAFEEEHETNSEKIKHELYKEHKPSQFLASYAPFVFRNLNHESMRAIVDHEIENFFINSLSLYSKELKEYPLHFVGSIAQFSSDCISRLCTKYEYNLGKIIQRPIIELANKIDDLKRLC